MKLTNRSIFNYRDNFIYIIYILPGVADSKTFDVTLMICLLRNFTMVTEPRYGYDCLPEAGETTTGADLARIKYYRNSMSHLDDNKIDNFYFNTAWHSITEVSKQHDK